MPVLSRDALVDLAARTFRIMEQWDDAEAARVIHPESVNHEAVAEPPEARGRGPAAYRATYDWLHAAYAELRWDVQQVLADGDLVAARCVMSGRHTGPFVTYDADGRIDQAFPPTGRSFASTQTHLYRMEDGLIAEHWANRDDLGQAAQLGWIPPSPVFLLRGALLKRRLSRR
jgi:predicted ester cyclase